MKVDADFIKYVATHPAACGFQIEYEDLTAIVFPFDANPGFAADQDSGQFFFGNLSPGKIQIGQLCAQMVTTVHLS